jgi:glycosyltransferase involved in cell wall biosynthesis
MSAVERAITNASAGCLRVAALTQGMHVPSTRFRVEQHINALSLLGIDIDHEPARHGAYPPGNTLRRIGWLPRTVADAALRVWRANDSDVCLLQRELVSTLHTAERMIKRPFIFDVDDAIFLHKRGCSVDAIAKNAKLIICGNSFLADHFSAIGAVEILPTAVNTSRFVPAPVSMARPIIGWSGSSSGFAYLESIQEPLRIVLDRFPDAVFSVIADRPPTLPKLPAEQLLFTRWTEDTEVQGLQSFSVGLMPLSDTTWSRGKCSFKMLTYMAVGVPVVVSPVGMNREVLALGNCGLAASSIDDWVDALTTLLRDQDLSASMGAAGRRIVESYYSLNVIAPRLAALLKSVSENR